MSSCLGCSLKKAQKEGIEAFWAKVFDNPYDSALMPAHNLAWRMGREQEQTQYEIHVQIYEK